MDQNSSILLRQPYDIRATLYEHLPLPPFPGYEDYVGFLTCCRQIPAEAEHEALRKLRIFLDKVESKLVGIKILRPKDFSDIRSVTVMLPFELPVHDFYRRVRLRGCVLRQPEEHALPDIRAKARYTDHIKTQIKAIRPLFQLHLDNVTFYLDADRETMTAIRTDEELINHQIRSMLGVIQSLQGTLLGRLIGLHDAAIGNLRSDLLRGFYQNAEPLNTPDIVLQWDFTENGVGEGQYMKTYHRHHNNDGKRHVEVFALDRLAGRTVTTMLKEEYFGWQEERKKAWEAEIPSGWH